MRKELLSLSLTEKEFCELAGRYHFDQAGLARIRILHEAILPLLCPQACYTIKEREVFCAVTLGEGIDRMQESCSLADELLDVYILDSIGASLLEKAYEQLHIRLFEETGLYLQYFAFPGSELPMTKMQEILQNLTGQLEKLPISCNPACMLTPKKSVVFMAELGEKRQDHGICFCCAMCSRSTCKNRRLPETENKA